MASGPLPGFDETRTHALLPTLEQVASGPALVSRFNQLHGNVRSGQEVLAAAAGGAERAARVVRSAAEALGGTIGLLVNVLDPQLVILGGGLGTSVGIYRDSLIDSARRHIWWHGHRDLPMVIATTGPEHCWLQYRLVRQHAARFLTSAVPAGSRRNLVRFALSAEGCFGS